MSSIDDPALNSGLWNQLNSKTKKAYHRPTCEVCGKDAPMILSRICGDCVDKSVAMLKAVGNLKLVE